jgi:glycosyltransferase 2 family protein
MNRPSAVALLRVVVFLGLIAVAVPRIAPDLLAGVLTTRLLVALLLAQPVVLATIFITAMRFAALVSPDTPLRPAFKAVMLSSGLNSMLPGRIAELLKPTYMRDHADVPLSAGVSAVFLERLIDLVFLGLFGALGAQLLAFGPSYSGVIIPIAAVSLLWLTIRYGAVLSRGVARIPSPPVRAFLTTLLERISQRADVPLLLKCGVLTSGIWALSYVCVVLVVAVAGRIGVDLGGALAVLLAATVGGAIPVLPAGMGTFEAAVVFVLQRYGYDFDEALVLAITLHLAFVLPNVIGAFLIAAFERTGIRALSRKLWNVWQSLDGGKS